jgi:geranylgeranyl diphosphate synthase type II
MELRQFLSVQKKEVEKELDRLLPPAEGEEKVLYEAMRYSVFAGGKRLRPCLFLAALEALGHDGKNLLPFACALEMIHTYSLIHDDLPAMDDDDLRRGKPTCHRAFNEAQAILAGDALLTYAFNCMIKVAPYAKAQNLLASIDRVAYCAGIRGMIVGQVADLAGEGRNLSQKKLRFIHENKTGALFKASLTSAALLADAGVGKETTLSLYAEKIGLVFQIADDILDVVGNEQKLGKTIGSDAKNQKTTYVSLLGLDAAKRLGRQTAAEAVRLLDGWGQAAQILRQIPPYFIDRES